MFATAVSPIQQPHLGFTPTSPTGFSLEAAALQPRLHNHAWIEKVRLSDDGFCDSTAHINLSHTLLMGLTADGSTLSYRALAEFGLGTRQAWDLAADNLVVAARHSQGTRFYLRDATEITLINTPGASSLQVKVPGAPVTAWLSHPRTFTILNNHLEKRLGPDLLYLAPLSDLLVVLPADSPTRPLLTKWAANVVAGRIPGVLSPGEEKIISTPLIYRLGFPSTMVATPSARRKQAA